VGRFELHREAVRAHDAVTELRRAVIGPGVHMDPGPKGRVSAAAAEAGEATMRLVDMTAEPWGGEPDPEGAKEAWRESCWS
jgi:hypothetical protein